ncbi:MAG: universal stress protein [Blastocatellia bacterium]|nr:universal stress protein [Blastocatellia bacterium]
MNLAEANLQTAPRTIFHPSDFSREGIPAFAHALRLAVAAQGRLTILHADAAGDEVHWSEFFKVRPMLERWGMIPPHSPRTAVADLGLSVEKIATLHKYPVDSILKYLGRNPHDLIVLATHQHDGLERWLHRSIAEPVARRSGEMTLFVPQGREGFIAPEDGKVHLGNILVPVDHLPDSQMAVMMAYAVAEQLGAHDAIFTLLHVGKADDFPPVKVPGNDVSRWRRLAHEGHVETVITEAATRLHARMIVMATTGHHGFLDALRGSTTERVVRAAGCPVLAVPADLRETVFAEDAMILQPAI